MMFGLLALFVATLIGLADLGRGREISVWVAQIPAGDKWGHFVLFGGLTFLANAALNGARFRLGSFTFLKGSLFVLVPTVLEEFSQLFFRSRTFDLRDLGADFVGIFLGGLLAVLWLRYLKLWAPRIAAVQSGDASAAARPLPGG